MAQENNFEEIIGYLSEEVVGEDLYLRWLHDQSRDGLVLRETRHGEMFLDIEDPGLSRRILRYGVHEETSSQIYRRELRKLADEIEGEVTVLEIGANIGYFLLMAADVLGERAWIEAIEPHPRNVEILRKNVSRNGLDEQVAVVEGAVGAEPGSGVLNVMPESNWHTVATDGGAHAGAVETLDIDIRCVESHLDEQGHTPEDVNVVRFDVEGYEDEILAGMQSVLEADSPLLCYVELHPVLLDDDTLEWVIEQFEESGLELVSAVDYEPIEWDGKPVPAEEFADIREYRDTGSLEIIARR